MKDQWSRIGVRAEAQLLQFAAMNERVQKARDFDAVITGLTAGIDPDQTAIWSSSAFDGGANYGRYSNPTVDQLLDQARTVPGCDQAGRKVLYDQIQTLIAEDQPFTFLYSVNSTVVMNKRVQNVVPHPWLTTGQVHWDTRSWTLAA